MSTMDINKIKTPAFIKELSISQLEDLSEQIRTFILNQLSRSGGYLSSNLGAVELTIAMHYCFDAPEDRILFDTGHQCLTHLILTGRSDEMTPLYMNSGSMASLNRLNSTYDVCDASHPASSLAYAMGIAVARDLKKENYHIVTMIGDRAFSSGLSLQALKQIGKQRRRLIIVLNDNGMTHFTNDSLMSSNISKVRNSHVYNGLKDGVKFALKKRKHGEQVIRMIHDLKERIKEPIVDSSYLKDFGFYYIGPVDGHDFKSLISAFETAKKKDDPVVVHCLTSKGKGYPTAEKDVSGKWDYVSAFDLKTGRSRSEMPDGEISCEEFAAFCVEQEMKTDQRIVLITAGKDYESGLESLFAKYPDRCFDVGLSVDYAVDLAAGLAMNDMKPYVSADSSLLGRAYDQLANDLAEKRLPVLFGISCRLDENNGEKRSSEVSYLKTLPGAVIAQGKDANEIRDLIHSGLYSCSLGFIRYERTNIRKKHDYSRKDIDAGKWEMLISQKDPDLYILSCGTTISKIAKTIMDNELNYALVNARFISPLDEEMLKEIFISGKPVYLYAEDLTEDLGKEIRLFAARCGFSYRLTEFINDRFSEIKRSVRNDIRALFEMIESDKKQEK